MIVSDLRKAAGLAGEAGEPEIEIITHVPETVEELRHLTAEYLGGEMLAVDIETPDITRPRIEAWPPVHPRDVAYISCIGFCADGENAVVVPFWYPSHPSGCWWHDASEHREVLACIASLLEDRRTKKVFHHGAFDVEVIWEVWGMAVRNFTEDTMLAHHAQFPEAPKGLGVLAAQYLHFRPWKGERRTAKRDDV
jgi:hypothetical protein